MNKRVVLQVVTIRLAPEVIARIDGAVKRGVAGGRSELIRKAVGQAWGTGEEPDNAGLFGPFITSSLLARHFRVATYALKTSAYADVVRAIIECERFVEEISEQVHTENRVIAYLDTLEVLEAGLAADLEPSRAEAEEKPAVSPAIREWEAKYEAAKEDQSKRSGKS